jgi:hypothetical protein
MQDKTYWMQEVEKYFLIKVATAGWKVCINVSSFSALFDLSFTGSLKLQKKKNQFGIP